MNRPKGPTGGKSGAQRVRSHQGIGVLAALALLAGCGGDGGSGAGESETGLGGLNLPPAGTPTCEGEAVPAQPSGLANYGFFQDARLLHDGDSDVQEQSLRTGEVEPLFELDDDRFTSPNVTADDRDVFAQDVDTIYRYSRASGELSVFAEPPAAGEVPDLPADLHFVTTLALSDSSVVTLLYANPDLNLEDLVLRRAYVAVYDRATGALRTFPALAPVELSVQLVSRGSRLVQIRTVDTLPELGVSQFAGSVALYDLATGSAQPFLESPSLFTQNNYGFWNDDFVAVIAPDSGSHQQLVRIPLAGGAPTVLVEDVKEPDLAILGDVAYVTLSAPGEGGRVRPQLTQVDLATGTTTPVGSCQGTAFYATGSDLYVSDPNRDELVRLRR